MKYLILGANGQLAKEFLKTLPAEKVIGLTRDKCDIANFYEVQDALGFYKPDITINCAAYNKVDDAEIDFTESFKVNSLGAYNLALACKNFNSFLVHYSTDYVFDGKKESGLYEENDKPNPINQYGRSKLLGEKIIKEILGDKFLIFRVSWVYGEGKQNFVYKVLSWIKKNPYLKVSFDEVSVPTATTTIVAFTLQSLKEGLTGVYHLTNSGYASRFEFAKKIIEFLGIRKFIKPVTASSFNLPAPRPLFSALSNQKLSHTLNVTIPHWEESLYKFLKGFRYV